jgi:hypothetical protein
MDRKTRKFQERIDLIMSRYTIVDQKFVRQEIPVPKRQEKNNEMIKDYKMDRDTTNSELISKGSNGSPTLL